MLSRLCMSIPVLTWHHLTMDHRAGQSCADGFERKEPSCGGCDNDFLMRNNAEDFPDCDCDAVPQLDALFAAMHSGDKRTVMSAINMTSVFIYQGFAVLVNNGDTGGHNYFMSKVVGEPWRVINADPVRGLGNRIWAAGPRSMRVRTLTRVRCVCRVGLELWPRFPMWRGCTARGRLPATTAIRSDAENTGGDAPCRGVPGERRLG